jgi:hypothetical protein
MLRHLTAAGVLLTLAACNFGCSSNTDAALNGQVTYEGKPVEKGRIEFLPADGKGAAAGADIVNGRYAISGLVPGSKTVQITAAKKIQFPRTTQELADQAAKGLPPPEPPAEPIPLDAEGNNLTIEVAAGSHARDFALSKPNEK